MFSTCLFFTGCLIFILIYFLITLSDLECDYLNATECCGKLNFVSVTLLTTYTYLRVVNLRFIVAKSILSRELHFSKVFFCLPTLHIHVLYIFLPFDLANILNLTNFCRKPLTLLKSKIA